MASIFDEQNQDNLQKGTSIFDRYDISKLKTNDDDAWYKALGKGLAGVPGQVLSDVGTSLKYLAKPANVSTDEWDKQHQEDKNWLTNPHNLYNAMINAGEAIKPTEPQYEENTLNQILYGAGRLPASMAELAIASRMGNAAIPQAQVMGEAAGTIGAAKLAQSGLSKYAPGVVNYASQKLPELAGELGSAPLKAIPEATMEQQDAVRSYIEEAKQNGTYKPGITEQEAEKIGQGVFNRNMALLPITEPLDKALLLGKPVGKLGKYKNFALDTLAGGTVNAFQENMQTNIPKMAANQPWSMTDKDALVSSAVGFLGSAVPSAANTTYHSIFDDVSKAKKQDSSEKSDIDKIAEYVDSLDLDETTRQRANEILANGTEEDIINLGKELKYNGQEAPKQQEKPQQRSFRARNTPIADGIEDAGLYNTNADLKNGIDTLNGWVYNNFGKDMTVSGGARSKEHNAEVGGHPNSEHLYGEAVDLDISDFSEEERKQIEAKAREAGFNTLYHDAGTGYHLHLGMPKSGKFSFDGLDSRSFADLEGELSNLYGGNDYLAQQMAEIDQELEELNKKEDATADDFLNINNLQTEKQRMQEKVKENEGKIKELEQLQDESDFDIDNTDKADVKARTNYTDRKMNAITQQLKKNNKKINGINATIRKNKGRTSDRQKEALDRLAEENKELIESLKAHKERRTNLQNVYDERYKAEDEAIAKAQKEEAERKADPFYGRTFNELADVQENNRASVREANAELKKLNEELKEINSQGAKGDLARANAITNRINDINNAISQTNAVNQQIGDTMDKRTFDSKNATEGHLKARAKYLEGRLNKIKAQIVANNKQIASIQARGEKTKDEKAIARQKEQIEKIAKQSEVLAKSTAPLEQEAREIAKRLENKDFVVKEKPKKKKEETAKKPVEKPTKEEKPKAKETVATEEKPAQNKPQNTEKAYTLEDVKSELDKAVELRKKGDITEDEYKNILAKTLKKAGDAKLEGYGALFQKANSDVKKKNVEEKASGNVADEGGTATVGSLVETIDALLDDLEARVKNGRQTIDETIKGLENNRSFFKNHGVAEAKVDELIDKAIEDVKTVEAKIKAEQKSKAETKPVEKELTPEEKQKQYQETKESERKNILEETKNGGDPVTKALEEKSKLEKDIESYLEPIVTALKKGVGNGITDRYVDTETGQEVDASDLRGKEETKPGSSIKHERFSNNDNWYSQFFAQYKRQPTKADYLMVAEEMARGKGAWKPDSQEVRDAAGTFDAQNGKEAAKEASEMLDYLHDMVQIYTELADEFKAEQKPKTKNVSKENKTKEEKPAETTKRFDKERANKGLASKFKKKVKNAEPQANDAIKIPKVNLVDESELDSLLADINKSINGKLSSTPVFDPDLMTKLFKVGMIYLQKGFNTFADWSNIMLKGIPNGKPFLKSTWNSIGGYKGKDFDGEAMSLIMERVGADLDDGKTIDQIKKDIADEYEDDLTAYIDSAYAAYKDFPQQMEENVVKSKVDNTKEGDTNATDEGRNAEGQGNQVGTGTSKGGLREREDKQSTRENTDRQPSERLATPKTENVQGTAENGNTEGKSGTSAGSQGPNSGRAESSKGVLNGRKGDGGSTPSAMVGRSGRDNGERGTGTVEGTVHVKENYHIDNPDALLGGTPKVRFLRNQKAIEIIKTLEEEGRDATEEEKAILSAFSGWGSFGQEVFQGTWERPIYKDGWKAENDWLRNHLGKEEWESARDSIINAHYTDPITVKSMWDMIAKMGFKGGRILEPSMGVGNFFALMPKEIMSNSTLTGIELETTTGKMAQQLYPNANIQIKGYQDSKTADNFYDLIIGNVPFHANGPSDRRYNKFNPTLHDYFFLKGLDQLRPGGLMVAITSKGTMDKADRKVRGEMAKKAELVGAFRLPTGAFENYAGTNVVTDILIFKKREKELGNEAYNETWVNADKKEIRFEYRNYNWYTNNYFKEHPENVLGKVGFGHGTTTGQPGLMVERQPDFQQKLENLKDRLSEDVYKPAERKEDTHYISNHTNAQQGSVVKQDKGLFVVQGDVLVPMSGIRPYSVKSEKTTKEREKAIGMLADLRDILGKVIDADNNGDKNAEKLRKELNKAYENFKKEFGPVQDSWALDYLSKIHEPSSALLGALENNDGEKATIFSRSTVRTIEKPANPTIEDAFIYNRNTTANVDIEAIAKDANTTPEEVAKKLISDGVIYKTPAGTYETKDQYLSGNVRIKLREAQDALDSGDADMKRNVEELKKVIPPTVPYYNIEANLGASWISPDYYKRFIADKLGLSKTDGITLGQANGGWVIKFENRGLDYTPLARSLSYGDVKFSKILEKAFNHQTITIKAKDDEGNEYVDKEASEKAQAKVDEIVDGFKDWLWQDNDRKVSLEKDYNEAMNAIATPQYDGSFMQMSGMALLRGDSEFSLRTHQSNAIYRGIVNGRGIYAHEVGTGKTYTMGGLAIESRKYGLARKPLILAHNANSSQVSQEIQEMYPGKKILYIDNLDKATIRRKLEQIKVDDWDAIVLPHSQMEKLTLKEETLMRFAADEIAELEDMAIAAAEEDGEKLTREKILEIEKENLDPKGKKGIPIHNPTAKKLVGQRNKIIENIKKQAAKSSAEDAISFEDLGIDMIIVDEAHVFKKPPFSTKMSMKGLNNSNSQAGIRLNFLCRYVQSLNNGKGVHLFTGTPITNTLAEMFHMMRYVMPTELKQAGVYDFDRWFNVFAAETNDLAITSSGEYENESRLASFTNVAELRRMAGNVMDIVFADDMPEFKPRETESGKTLDSKDLTDKERDELLNGRTENAIGRPYKKIVNIEIPLDSNQNGILKYLVNLAKEWKQADKNKRKEWMKSGDEHSPLLVETAANNAGLDARLYNPNITDDGTAKEAQCVKNVIDIFRQGDKEHPAVQAIFMERGFSDSSTKTLTNSDGSKTKLKVNRFNMAKSLKAKIAKEGAKYGLTEDKIVIIDGTVKPKEKAELAKKLAKGELYVVIGSTQTLGTGVNMQANLRAMHHLDAPWTPAELEQRNGRGHRQGNKWNTVLELRYLAEKLDGKRWQVLSIKQKFIKMFMKADESLRTIEGDAVDMQDGEGGSDLQETLSKAAGDPRIMLKAKYEGDIKKLQQKERIFVNGIADTKQRIKDTERRIEIEEKSIADKKKDAETYAQHKDEPFEIKLATSLKPGSNGRKTFDKPSEANEHLQKIFSDLHFTGTPYQLGTYKGFNLRVVKNVAPVKAALDNKEAYQYDIYIEGVGYPFMAKDSVASVTAVLRNQAESRLTDTMNTIDKLKEQLGIMKKNVEGEFPQKESLEKRKKLLADLELDLKENPTPAPQWLIQGSPVDNDVYYQGKRFVVTGHKANNDGFYVTGIDDSGKTVNIPYQEAKDEHNMDLYDALQHGYTPEYKAQSPTETPSAHEETAEYGDNLRTIETPNNRFTNRPSANGFINEAWVDKDGKEYKDGTAEFIALDTLADFEDYQDALDILRSEDEGDVEAYNFLKGLGKATLIGNVGKEANKEYKTSLKNFDKEGELSGTKAGEKLKQAIQDTLDYGTREGEIVQASDSLSDNSDNDKSGRDKSNSKVQKKPRLAKTEGIGITRELVNEGAFSLVGKRIESVQDLAEYAQVLRHPGYEKFHRVFVDYEGNIVGHDTVSSMLPAESQVYAGVKNGPRSKEDNLRWAAEAWRYTDLVNDYSVDKVYYIHNHPSEDPTPSQLDIDLTNYLIDKESGDMFGGHIILDTTEYSLLNGTEKDISEAQRFKVPDNKQIKYGVAGVPHAVVGQKLSHSDVVSRYIKEINDTSVDTLFFADNKMNCRAVVTLPKEVANMDEAKLGRYIRLLARKHYASGVIPVTRDRSMFDKYKNLYKKYDNVYDVIQIGPVVRGDMKSAYGTERNSAEKGFFGQNGNTVVAKPLLRDTPFDSRDRFYDAPYYVPEALPEAHEDKATYGNNADNVYVSDLKRAAEKILPIKTEKVYRDTQDEYDSHSKVGLIHNNGDTTNLAGIVGMHIDREKGITRANKAARKEILAKADENARASLDPSELAKFYNLPEFKRIKRGVAAFMRTYARDKEQAQKEYPIYYRAFEKMMGMPVNSNLKAKVDNFVDVVQKYEGLTEEGKARASKSRPKPNESLKDKVKKFFSYSKWFEDKDAIQGVTKEVVEITGKQIEAEKDPYKQARLSSTTITNRVTALLQGPTNATKEARDILWNTLNACYDNVMKNKVFFSDVIAKANELNAKMEGDGFEAERLRRYLKNNNCNDWNDVLGTYLMANRFLEIWKTKPNYVGAMTKARAKRVVDFAPKEIKEAAQLYYKFDQDLLRIMQHDGLLSKEAFEALNKYEAYCPLFRDFADDEAYDKYMEHLGSKSGFANLSNGIKYLTEGGSDRNVLDDPVLSMMRMTGAIISKCERNKVSQKLVALTQRSGIGGFAMPAYDAEGKQLHSPNPQESRFTVYENGVKNAYRTTPELYQALTGSVDVGELTMQIIEFISIPSQTLRFGATSTPGFMLANATMDTVTAGVISRNGFLPLWGTLHGLYLLAKDKKTSAEYRLSGAAMGDWRYQDRTKEFETLNEMAGRDPEWYNANAFTKIIAPAHKYFFKLYEPWRKLGEMVENSNRIEEFYLAKKNGKSDIQAALDAKEVTTDFTRGGEYGRVYNRITPFFNATLQGGDRLVRAIAERPAEVLSKMAVLMVMAATYWSYVNDEDWWKEKSNEEKMSAMFIPYKDDKGKLKLARIPYPHELGLMSCGIMITGLEAMKGENPGVAKDFAQQVILQTTPTLYPAMFRPMIEVATNYDLYFNSPIETKKDMAFTKEARIGSTTSKTAIYGGKASKAITDASGGLVPQLSPKEIEHLIRGYMGDTGKILAHSLDDNSSDYAPNVPVVRELVNGLIGMGNTVGRRFVKKEFDHPKSVDDWYDLKTELEQYNNTYRPGQKLAYMQGVQNITKAISKINRQISTIQRSNIPEDRKDEIISKLTQESAKLARHGLNIYRKYLV